MQQAVAGADVVASSPGFEGEVTFPVGEAGEGVVRRRPPFKANAAPTDSYVMHAYRFQPEDFGA